jgi:hypothetical protein
MLDCGSPAHPRCQASGGFATGRRSLKMHGRMSGHSREAKTGVRAFNGRRKPELRHAGSRPQEQRTARCAYIQYERPCFLLREEQGVQARARWPVTCIARGHEERPARSSPTAAWRLDRPIHRPGGVSDARLGRIPGSGPALGWSVHQPADASGCGAPAPSPSGTAAAAPSSPGHTQHATPGRAESSSACIHDEHRLAISPGRSCAHAPRPPAARHPAMPPRPADPQ